jgi:hypothetical protein
MTKQERMPLLTEEISGLAVKAAEACERAQSLFAEGRVDDGRRWLMKALYASDQLQRLTMRGKHQSLMAKKKPDRAWRS